MHLHSVVIPAVLAFVVISLHLIFPQIAVLALVSMSAIGLVLGVLCWRDPSQAAVKLYQHAATAAPRMGRELGLFLGAGVLTLGLQTVLVGVGDLQWLKQLTGFEASLLLGAAILVSILGIHPIISISVVGPLVLPLKPDLELLATLFLAMWSLGVVANPISGTNVMLYSQFKVAGRDALRWNLRYVVWMWLAASVIFLLLAAYRE